MYFVKKVTLIYNDAIYRLTKLLINVCLNQGNNVTYYVDLYDHRYIETYYMVSKINSIVNSKHISVLLIYFWHLQQKFFINKKKNCLNVP